MNTTNEEWRDIKGYEGLYQISNRGRVRSFSRDAKTSSGSYYVKGRIMSRFRHNGYEKVRLTDANGVQKNFFIHRLVASAFVANPKHYKQVNHRDGDKGNNHASNLEWCTQRNNLMHAVDHNLIKSYHIIERDENGNFLKEWPSMGRISEYRFIPMTTLRRACDGTNGKRGHEAQGSYWYYKDPALIEKLRRTRRC